MARSLVTGPRGFITHDYVFTLGLTVWLIIRTWSLRFIIAIRISGHYRPIVKPAATRDISFVGTAYPKRIQFFEPIMDQLMAHRTFINGNGGNGSWVWAI